MPHIHELIDFTVVAYIVHENKVLLVDHKENKMWLPVGGHVELHEDSEEALVREIQEECGLEVEILGEKPVIIDSGAKPLIPPLYMDIHDINETHRHVGLVYFARAKTDKVKLAEKEHHQIKWFTRDELKDPQYTIRPYVRFYAVRALEKITGLTGKYDTFYVGANVLAVSDGKLLLLGKRKSVYGDGTWGLPGGHLELGESMLAAAARELKEETGLVAKKISFISLANNPRENQGNRHYIQLGFLAEGIEGEPKNLEPDRCEEWRWFDLNKLPEPIFHGHRKLIQLYQEGKTNFSDSE